MQIPHVVTVGDLGRVTSMHGLHRGDASMQNVRGHDQESASNGHNMQLLHTGRLAEGHVTRRRVHA